MRRSDGGTKAGDIRLDTITSEELHNVDKLVPACVCVYVCVCVCVFEGVVGKVEKKREEVKGGGCGKK